MTEPAPQTRSPHAGTRRSELGFLVLGSAVGSTGLAAGGTAAALLATHLAGTPAVAGLPLGLLVLGSAAAAVVISRSSRRLGRIRSLSGGYLVGASGAATVVVAASIESLPTLLAGSLLLGSANAALFLTRYAAADIADRNVQGRALALVLFSTTVGAVASPLLLGPTGTLARAVGLPTLAGLFLTAAISFTLAAGVLAGFHHARGSAPTSATSDQTARHPTRRELTERLGARPVLLGLGALMAGNFVMVAVMTVALIHLVDHGHGLEGIGIMISLHVAGMFAPSPLAGWACDRAGPLAVAALGCALLLLASLAGVVLSYTTTANVALHLVVLGIGWNFAIVGGSMSIARSVPAALRVDVEGMGEVAMGGAAAIAAPMAGATSAAGGFGALSLLGAAVAGAGVVGAWVTGATRDERLANGCSMDEDAQGA